MYAAPVRFQPSSPAHRGVRLAYAGVGDKEGAYLVTSDGEVYYWRYVLAGLGRLTDSKTVFLHYSAVSGAEPHNDWFQYAAENADAVFAKTVASWDDYETAKAYANSIVAAARKGEEQLPAEPYLASAPTKTSSIPGKKGGRGGKRGAKKEDNPLLVGGAVVGTIALLGTLAYLARRTS